MDSLDIVTTARKWLGTPFHHQGRVPNVGLDCVGLVIQVAKELNLSNFDTTNYSAIPDGKVLKSLCEQEMIEVPYINAQYGDVLLFKFGERPQHLGIIGDYLYGGFSIIHAYAVAGKVVETRLDDFWIQKLISCYRLPGVD
jgi:cell wall-associated NlpC family hydrolase